MLRVKYILFYTFMERNDFVLWLVGTFCQCSCYKKSTVGRIKKRQPSIKVIFFCEVKREFISSF